MCVPLILVISFGPLKEAAQTSDELVMVSGRNSAIASGIIAQMKKPSLTS
jgi:hypothetical protein